MPIAGDKPGKGVYICTICGFKVKIDSAEEELTFCPICHGASYLKKQ